MTTETVDQGRRRFLTATTAVIGAAGVVTAIVPFVKSWEPSARAKAAGGPVTIDVSKVKPGQIVDFGWRGLPVAVVNRTKAQLATLTTKEVTSRLKDPDCLEFQQPANCKNPHRSIKAQYLVMIRICTHLGCVPDFEPKIGPQFFDPHWQSGFFCPCHHSRYDISGRVYDGSPAPLNMSIPNYEWLDDTHVRIVDISSKEYI